MTDAPGTTQHSSKADPIVVISRASREVASSFTRDRLLLRRFLNTPDGLLKRRQESTHGSATCTGFSLYYLAGAGLLQSSPTSTSRHCVLSCAEARAAVNGLAQKILAHAPATDVSPAFPNQYNTPIRLAGYLRSVRFYGDTIEHDIKTAVLEDVSWIVSHVAQNGGRALRLTAGPPQVSPYHTFWCVAAMVEAQAQFGGEVEGVNGELLADALLDAANWSETQMATKIAYHHAGLSSRFDTIELIYSCLAAVLLRPESADVGRLMRHALGVILAHPYFSDGCFMPSAPVLADNNSFILQCPTAEVLGLLLAISPTLAIESWEPLYEAHRWLVENRRIHDNQCDGWCPEGLGRQGDPTAFMSVSALTTLRALSDLLDNALDATARQLFGVTEYSEDERLKTINYPASFERIVSAYVIKPLTSTPRRDDLASYSLILFGPPGTSKTTIAAKIAQDLRWPLLTLGQSDFLRRGLDNIDVEADRIFRLASCLKEVVILFDEIEELVQNREGSHQGAATDKLSRLLTTSMLPRLHQLRDGKRVVFILATNRLDSIDTAAARRGRFDIVHGVLPPEETERKHMVEIIFQTRRVSEDARQAFMRASFPTRTPGFGFADLDATVKAVLIQAELLSQHVDEALIMRAIEDGRTAVTKTIKDLESFKQAKDQYDRPKSA